MIKLKELLKNNNRIRILVNKNEYIEFLKWAKENECLWDDGRIIHPENDLFLSGVVAINDRLLIHHPRGWMANLEWSNFPGYRFSDLKKDVVFDVNKEIFIEKERKINRDKIKNKKRELLFNEKCKRKRIISNRQIQYVYIAEVLPDYFYVKYDNESELSKLMLLLQDYGFENINEIDKKIFDEIPHALFVNRKYMKFIHHRLLIYLCAALRKIKVYKYHKFEELIRKEGRYEID